jgi:hypothetical protein
MGLIVCRIIGIIMISWPVMVGIVIIGGIVMYRLRQR